MINREHIKNDIYFVAENDIRNICKTVLDPVGITYFNYLRYYNDGSCYLLTTHSDLISYVFEHNIPVAAPVAQKYVKQKFNYLILPIGKYDQLVHHAKINLNLENFIDIVDRYDDYIELFCFGSTPGNSEIIQFYLNNLDFLNKFKSYFKNKATRLLEDGEKNKIILPEIMKPPYQGLNESGLYKSSLSNRFYIKHESGDIKLTSRQYDCLTQLAAGCTAKEASRNLGISHRTYENYLANLKSVLDCHKKSQLINLFLNNTF